MKWIFASYPRIDGQYGRVPAVKFVICGVLLLAMLLFGKGVTHTLKEIRQHNAWLEQRTYELPWSLMQLQLEMSRFLDAVRLRHADAITQDDLMLRYDILWSRTPILMSNQFKNTLNDRPDLWLLIGQIDARIRELEQRVETLVPDSATYLVILTELGPYLEPLARTVTAIMHDNVTFYAEYDQAYRQLGKRLYEQVMGFFIVLLCLLFLLFREWRRYWILQQQDPLTGLPNRFALQRYLDPLIAQGQPFSVTVLELKDFSTYHHRFGFEVMDRLLQACCRQLQHSLLPHEFMAQPAQGGVVVLAPGVVELAEVRAQMSRFRQALAEKITVDGHDFYMEPLMGVVLHPSDADNLVDLLARGELALELCKQQQSPYVFFDPSLLKETARRQQLDRDLPAALDSNSLTLQLQPLLAWPSQQCIGLQVLTSWHHPGFGVISSTELQRISEQYQRSESLMLWTLQSICGQLAVWQRYSDTPLFISVQLPAALFRPGIEVTLMSLLQQFELSPASLVLEINDSVTQRDAQQAALVLQRIKAVGIRVILTEFGSSRVALGPLSQLPCHWLKLDATFCTGIEHQGESRRQLETLFAVAEVLQHPLICCGVDHASELAVLESLGKPLLVQGDAVAEALLVTEVVDWLKAVKNSAR